MSDMPEIAFFPSGSLPNQPWASALHNTIIKAFKRKDIQAFPPSWTRLHQDPTIGIDRLAGELGPDGYLAIVFVNGYPVGCGGTLPFRGNDWINKEKSADAAPGDITAHDEPIPNLHGTVADEFEICCFCVHPDYRKQGLSKILINTIVAVAREKGGKRLAVNYSVEETGDYWPRLGFEEILGATSILKKGFTHTVGMEGLREDIHFQIAIMSL